MIKRAKYLLNYILHKGCIRKYSLLKAKYESALRQSAKQLSKIDHLENELANCSNEFIASDLKVIELTKKLEENKGNNPFSVPLSDITYERPILVSKNKWIHQEIDVRLFIQPDFYMVNDLKRRGLLYSPDKNLDELIPKLYKHAKRDYSYGPDILYGFSEFWMFPFELRAILKKKKSADCIANYEEIYTIEGIKKVGNLRVGDLVLSYDWNSQQYCYKPITKIWEKGKLKIKRAYLRNGNTIDITENHPLWVRKNPKGKSVYEKKQLSDICHRWWKRKFPVAKKIPYSIKDINWLTKDLCFVIGHFIAEGYTEKYRVCTCGYECNLISDILDKNNIPFAESKNNNGVPIITFLKSDFKNYLKKILRNSFDITLPEEIFHLPESKIRALLKGYLMGDGYIDKREYPFKHNSKFFYSTSSDQLKSDLVRLHLQIGEPVYSYYQKNHQGAGNKPIWRIHYNPESFFARDYGWNGLSETSLVCINDVGKFKCRDFHVKDTSTFFFKNGLCSHQCDDWAIWIGSHFAAAGIPRDRWLISAGETRGGYGHATVYVKDNLGVWRHMNSTSSRTYDLLPSYPNSRNKKDRSGIEQNGFWFSFNDKYAIHEFESKTAEMSFKESRIKVRIVKEAKR